MKIEMRFRETLESALLDSIEHSYGYDEFGIEDEGYNLIADDEHLFKTVNEAILYALKVDEVFKKVRHLNLSDYVVPVYDDDGYLLYYLSEKEAQSVATADEAALGGGSIA